MARKKVSLGRDAHRPAKVCSTRSDPRPRSHWGFVTHRCTKPPALTRCDRCRMVRADVSSDTTIPRTLTLSHGEREHSAPGRIAPEVCRADTALGFPERQRTILPLSRGEGRGGNADVSSANRVGTSPQVRSSPEGPYEFEPFI